MRILPKILRSVCTFLTVASLARADAMPTNTLRQVLADARLTDGKRHVMVAGFVTVAGNSFILEDDGILCNCHCINVRPPPVGSQVVVWGEFQEINGLLDLMVRNVKTIGSDPARIPKPIETTIEGFLANPPVWRMVTLVGTVDNAFRDEIDQRFLFFILKDGNARVNFAFCDNARRNDLAQKLQGAKVRVTGLTASRSNGRRRFTEPMFVVREMADIQVLEAAPEDLSGFPPLDTKSSATPSAVDAMGKRRLEGHVRAAWGGNAFLLRDAAGGDTVVSTALGAPLPAVGQSVVAAGHPETDCFNLSPSRAMWKSRPEEVPFRENPAKPLDIESLHTDLHNNRSLNPVYHGQPCRIAGLVLERSLGAESGDVLTLCDKHNLKLEVVAGNGTSGFAGILPGSKVETTGVCLMKTTRWNPSTPFARVNGFMLVTRRDGDVRILAQPPWWTPTRLFIAVGCLAGAIVILIAIVVALNRLAMRRGRELLRATIDRERANLKADERTRLAIELHDSLSQNLSGIGCQIVATRQVMPSDALVAARSLDTAERMLLSTRTELKRCLFDLRGDALDCLDFEVAVRITLAPVVGSARLDLRLRVARTLLSDSKAHAALCILRELASNAVVHGKATRIAIAGSIDRGLLMMSCRDDGSGFDPSTSPGPATGHFGLVGIRERARRLGGVVTIRSDIAAGTYAKVILTLKGAAT